MNDFERRNGRYFQVLYTQLGQFDPKFQAEGVAPTNHSSC